jgi:hypothetical protein
MVADSLLANHQRACDLSIAHAGRQQVKDFAFPLGQFGKWMLGLWIVLGKEVDQSSRNAWTKSASPFLTE